MAYIENYEILKKESDEKKIVSALKRIEKATKEITKLGYELYLSAHGSLNVMNIDDVPYKNSMDFHNEQVVAHGHIDNIDAGDW